MNLTTAYTSQENAFLMHIDTIVYALGTEWGVLWSTLNSQAQLSHQIKKMEHVTKLVFVKCTDDAAISVKT